MTKELQKRPQVPLSYAAMTLGELCDAIDEGADITELVIARFEDAKLDLRDGVDRRVAFLQFCTGAIDRAKAARDAWINRIRQMEEVAARVKDETMKTMKANPDLPYEGDIGKLAIQKNPPAVELSFEQKTMHVKACREEDLEAAGVDPRFIKAMTYYAIMIDEVKTALKNGEEIPWAKLTQGEHLRIREV